LKIFLIEKKKTLQQTPLCALCYSCDPRVKPGCQNAQFPNMSFKHVKNACVSNGLSLLLRSIMQKAIIICSYQFFVLIHSYTWKVPQCSWIYSLHSTFQSYEGSPTTSLSSINAKSPFKLIFYISKKKKKEEKTSNLEYLDHNIPY
jgi:hypothetical protein